MKQIYFDYAATTPVDEDVFQQMMPYFTQSFANANSSYTLARQTAYALDCARRQIAEVISCKSEELFFTSGGSESNNWAIKGIVEASKKNRIITSSIEHPSVLNACKSLESKGYQVTYLPVDENGLVKEEDLFSCIDQKRCHCICNVGK